MNFKKYGHVKSNLDRFNPSKAVNGIDTFSEKQINLMEKLHYHFAISWDALKHKFSNDKEFLMKKTELIHLNDRLNMVEIKIAEVYKKLNTEILPLIGNLVTVLEIQSDKITDCTKIMAQLDEKLLHLATEILNDPEDVAV